MANIYHSKVMKSYEEKRKRKQEVFDERIREIHQKVPKMIEIEQSFLRGSQMFMGLAARGQAITEDFMTDFKEKQNKLKSIKKKTLMNAGYSEDYLDMKYECKDCSDTGFIGVNRCKCYDKELIEVYYKESNVGSMIKNKDVQAFCFEDYETEVRIGEEWSDYDKVIKLQEFLLKKVQSKETAHLCITGGYFEDRTQIGLFITQKAIQSGKSAIFLSAEQLSKIFNEWRFNRKNVSMEVKNLKESLDVVDVLVLDALGEELNAEMTASDLFELINKRMMLDKTTIITTRLTIQQCREIYSDRIVSRLIGYSEYIKIPSKKHQ